MLSLSVFKFTLEICRLWQMMLQGIYMMECCSKSLGRVPYGGVARHDLAG